MPNRSSVLSALAFALLLSACLTKLPSLSSSSSSNGSPTETGAGGGGGDGAGGGASGSCCVNGASYQCPSADALDRCSGALARCMTGCAFSDDMNCPDSCVASHPPDPSGCSRDPGADSSCAR